MAPTSLRLPASNIPVGNRVVKTFSTTRATAPVFSSKNPSFVPEGVPFQIPGGNYAYPGPSRNDNIMADRNSGAFCVLHQWFDNKWEAVYYGPKNGMK